MAESPESWDLITASLALCNLQRPFEAWAFLVVQGLVRDEPGDRDTFAHVVADILANEITGPTSARRIASHLMSEGIGLPVGETEDPWARIAAGRRALIEPWTGQHSAAAYLERLNAVGR